jgi:hypothetical protein
MKRSTMVGYRSAIITLLLLHTQQAASYYSNVTLTSNNGDLSVVLYLPQGLKKDEAAYYSSTRFDHGSMIGSITRRTRDAVTGKEHVHELYGSGQWRIPHDPWWTESGIGLASEFGVGDDGSFCNYRCGWYQAEDVTNGVLGYREARSGDSFLKIGVGELIKGSCPTCDSSDDYRFNSPYAFAKPPVWTMQTGPDPVASVTLEHEAKLNQHGYKLKKEITLIGDELKIKNTLMNLGTEPFATAWYSHNFFTCDNKSVGKGYVVDLNLTGTAGRYDEPGTWFWSTPLQAYAEVTASPQTIEVKMERQVEPDVKIKAEFVRDDTSNGGFTIKGCGTQIRADIPDINTENGVTMYAYNLYIESGTFSPETQVYMHLLPGASISWTQRLVFSDDVKPAPARPVATYNLKTIAQAPVYLEHSAIGFLMYVLLGSFVALFAHRTWQRSQSEYSPIPDH